MRRIDKPWGYELVWAETSSYVGKILHIDAGKRLSFQYHREKEETLMVQTGRVRATLADADEPPRIVVLEAGEVIHIPPGRRHRFEALTDVDLIEVSTTQLDDVVRLSDDYGRAESDPV